MSTTANGREKDRTAKGSAEVCVQDNRSLRKAEKEGEDDVKKGSQKGIRYARSYQKINNKGQPW